MKKSTKAVLFSTLVFPGTGHYVLRRWIRGSLFLIPALLSLGILVDYQVDRALEIVDQVLLGEISPDHASLEAELRKPPPVDQALILNASILLFLACWGGAAIDAWFQGRKVSSIRENMDGDPSIES